MRVVWRRGEREHTSAGVVREKERGDNGGREERERVEGIEGID